MKPTWPQPLSPASWEQYTAPTTAVMAVKGCKSIDQPTRPFMCPDAKGAKALRGWVAVAATNSLNAGGLELYAIRIRRYSLSTASISSQDFVSSHLRISHLSERQITVSTHTSSYDPLLLHRTRLTYDQRLQQALESSTQWLLSRPWPREGPPTWQQNSLHSFAAQSIRSCRAINNCPHRNQRMMWADNQMANTMIGESPATTLSTTRRTVRGVQAKSLQQML